MPRTFTLTGSVEEANTLFTARISAKIWLSASAIAAPPPALVTPKYPPFPLALLPTLLRSSVLARPWVLTKG
ncbi:MAG: hypothetical protein ACREQL_03840, partial [Candidatus Binatia bacterium]